MNKNNVYLIKKLFPNNKWSVDAVTSAWLVYEFIHYIVIDIFNENFDHSVDKVVEAVEFITIFPDYKKSDWKKYADSLWKEWLEKSSLVEMIKDVVNKELEGAEAKVGNHFEPLWNFDFSRKAFGFAVAEVVKDTFPKTQEQLQEFENSFLNPLRKNVLFKENTKSQNTKSLASISDFMEEQNKHCIARWLLFLQPNLEGERTNYQLKETNVSN